MPGAPRISVNPQFREEIRTLLLAGQQVIAINGCRELGRAVRCLQEIGYTMGGLAPDGTALDPWSVYVWSPSQGLTWDMHDFDRKPVKIDFLKDRPDNFRDPLALLRYIPEITRTFDPRKRDGGHDPNRKAFFIFQNLDPYLLAQPPVLRDLLRVMVDDNRFTCTTPGAEYNRQVVLLHQAPALHPEVRDYTAPVTFPPPTIADLIETIEYVGETAKEGPNNCPEDFKGPLAMSLRGLPTCRLAEDVLSQALIANKAKGGWHPDVLYAVEQAKADQIAAGGVLTYVPRTEIPSLGEISGWDAATQFLREHCYAYTPDGRRKGRQPMRGVLLVGMSGGGKSFFGRLATRIIYETTGLVFPTYEWKFDRAFSKGLGDTEAAVRLSIDTLDAQLLYILICDEFNHMMQSGGDRDGGTTERAVTMFMDWLDKRTKRVTDEPGYGPVIATANSIEGIDYAFIRRFDGVFFVDLPDERTRREIFQIQLRKQLGLAELDPARFRGDDGTPMTPEDWAQLVRQSEDFSGAEIETVVRQAINIADTARPKVDDNAPTFEELLTAVERVQRTCVAKVAPKEIAGMREWGRDRAMSIYVPEEVKPGIFAGRRGGRGISTN